jgi:hypothetical protein
MVEETVAATDAEIEEMIEGITTGGETGEIEVMAGATGETIVGIDETEIGTIIASDTTTTRRTATMGVGSPMESPTIAKTMRE